MTCDGNTHIADPTETNFHGKIEAPTRTSQDLLDFTYDACGDKCFKVMADKISVRSHILIVFFAFRNLFGWQNDDVVWDSDDISKLQEALSVFPDLSPCQIAEIYNLPCFEVRYRCTGRIV